MSSSWERDRTCPVWRTKAASRASSRADSGTSRPFSTARWATGSTVSGPALRARSTPASPSSAEVTTNPRDPRPRSTISRMRASSSMSNTWGIGWETYPADAPLMPQGRVRDASGGQAAPAEEAEHQPRQQGGQGRGGRREDRHARPGQGGGGGRRRRRHRPGRLGGGERGGHDGQDRRRRGRPGARAGGGADGRDRVKG